MNAFKEPLDLMKHSVGQKIYIRLRNGTEIDGHLAAYDEHLNLMLQDASISRANGGSS